MGNLKEVFFVSLCNQAGFFFIIAEEHFHVMQMFWISNV